MRRSRTLYSYRPEERNRIVYSYHSQESVFLPGLNEQDLLTTSSWSLFFRGRAIFLAHLGSASIGPRSSARHGCSLVGSCSTRPSTTTTARPTPGPGPNLWVATPSASGLVPKVSPLARPVKGALAAAAVPVRPAVCPGEEPTPNPPASAASARPATPSSSTGGAACRCHGRRGR